MLSQVQCHAVNCNNQSRSKEFDIVRIKKRVPVKSYYHAPVFSFLIEQDEHILGVLAAEHHHSLEEHQRWAWIQQISILKRALSDQLGGHIFLEFYIPRMGKRADTVLVSKNIAFVIEFKVGARGYASSALDQVEDYALDLKNFHEGSHDAAIIPVLVSTNAADQPAPNVKFANDLVASPISTNASGLRGVFSNIGTSQFFPSIDIDEWMSKGYKPTPTIIEAAQILYQTHNVVDISRSDAGAKNLHETSSGVSDVIDKARHDRKKSICFVTGVPGSGKTLAGLNIATRRSEEHHDEHAVFLSGNGPLVQVLREALARDKVAREGACKKSAEREVRSFIQNIHHFRDEYFKNNEIPVEKVVVFDEAQRAWTREQAAVFMRKRGYEFAVSEPEFLISVMDRHPDWCTVVCLVGGGQEINTGEAGISEWIRALETRFTDWDVHVSPRISLPEYGSQLGVKEFLSSPRVCSNENLHLAVSMRSFRAETLSDWVGHVISDRPLEARCSYKNIQASYPIYLTRDLALARTWIRNQARGTERFGLVASSGAQRLRPEGIHVKAEIDPANWFLNVRADVRSSYYLEDVATEFDIQGLELDWVGVCWDADFRHDGQNWVSLSFKGTKWQSVNDESKRLYLRNSYRVLLTRARQGMILFIPPGDSSDPTRHPAFYDRTFEYLRLCGIPVLELSDSRNTTTVGTVTVE
jgi:hypothetical protein